MEEEERDWWGYSEGVSGLGGVTEASHSRGCVEDSEQKGSREGFSSLVSWQPWGWGGIPEGLFLGSSVSREPPPPEVSFILSVFTEHLLSSGLP